MKTRYGADNEIWKCGAFEGKVGHSDFNLWQPISLIMRHRVMKF